MSAASDAPFEVDQEKQEPAETHVSTYQKHQSELDAVFGGPEERERIERRLLWKLDLRMSILILIYILNYVRRLILICLACNVY